MIIGGHQYKITFVEEMKVDGLLLACMMLRDVR